MWIELSDGAIKNIISCIRENNKILTIISKSAYEYTDRLTNNYSVARVGATVFSSESPTAENN